MISMCLGVLYFYTYLIQVYICVWIYIYIKVLFASPSFIQWFTNLFISWRLTDFDFKNRKIGCKIPWGWREKTEDCREWKVKEENTLCNVNFVMVAFIVESNFLSTGTGSHSAVLMFFTCLFKLVESLGDSCSQLQMLEPKDAGLL